MGEGGSDPASSGGQIGDTVSARPSSKSKTLAFWAVLAIALATLINSLVHDIQMRLAEIHSQPSTADVCEKLDSQAWACDRTGNVFVLCQDFQPVDAPLLNLLFYRGNYTLWPRHIVVPDPSDSRISRQLLFNSTLPHDQWLADHDVRTLLVYQAGSMPPVATVYKVKLSLPTHDIAAPAGPEAAAIPGAIFWCCLYVVILMISGFAVTGLAFGRSRLCSIEFIGASAAIGAAIISLLLIALSMFGWTPSRGAILIFGVIGLLIVIVRPIRHRALNEKIVRSSPTLSFSMWYVIPLVALVYGIGALGYDALVRHTIMWDAFAIWQLKAKVLLYASLASHPAYFSDASFSYSHLRYPVLLPMLSAGVHAIVGHVDEILDKAPCLLLYLAMGAMVYGLVRSWHGSMAAIFAAALLMTQDPTLYLGGTGTADVAIAAFGAGSFIFLLRYLQDQRMGDLVMMFLFSAACMWTKNEGQAVALANVLVLWLMSPKPFKPRAIVTAIIVSLLLLLCYLPWMEFIKDLPRTDEDYAGRLSPANIIACLPNVLHVAPAVLKQMVDFKLKGGFWILLPILAVFGPWHPFTRPVLALWLIILLHLAIWIVVFIVTPLNFDTLLPAVGGRLLMQLAPAAALLIGLQWPGNSPDILPLARKIKPTILQGFGRV